MAIVLTLAAALCIVAPPAFDPRTEPADTIVVGRAIMEPADTFLTSTRIRILRTLTGSFDARDYDLEWHVSGTGMCPARGPRIVKGQTVVIYFRGSPGAFGPVGWLRVEDARRIDPFVAKALVQ